MFSKRSRWDQLPNALTLARATHAGELLDLTESNPTRAGLPYPLDELSNAIARAAKSTYEPEPLGLLSARETVAEMLGCDVDDVVITASTSEAYSFLFKLLGDPGDVIVTATPTYPLLEHLAALELLELRSFALEFHRRWTLDPVSLRAAIDAQTRAIVVVSPNNPTGSYVSANEQDELASFGLPLISDEVFHDYTLEGNAPTVVRDDVLTFTLGGLSKSAGLPHYKLGWIRISGPPRQRREAVAALELIADNFLSVATPVQQALPELLVLGKQIRRSIQERTRSNLDMLTRLVASIPSLQRLPVEGGWTAVVRAPRVRTDEELALLLLREQSVLIHPGYFFDFANDGYLVVSLLTKPAVFEEGVRRIIDTVASVETR